jgi:hypothetical protein
MSDVHLAEVASAHQILALVLGERAEVDAALRRRMYALPHQEAAITAKDEYKESLADLTHDGVSVAVEPVPRRRRPEIPDWLRDKPRRPNRWLPLAAVALLVGIGLSAFLLFGRSWTPTVASLDAPESSAEATTTTPPADASSAPANAADDAAGDAAAASTSENAADETSMPNGADRHAAPAADVARAERAPDVSPLRNLPQGEPGFETDAPPGEDMSPADPSAPMAADDGPATALTAQALVPGQGDADSEPSVAVGRLINDTEILLHAIAPDGAWRRLSMRDALVADEELLALPTFRPGIALSSGGGAIVHVLGGSVIRLLAPDENDLPGLHVIDGQVVVATAGKPGTQLNLQISDQVYRVTFVGPDARLAVDVRRVFPDGAEPLEEQVTTIADLYVPSGEIQYSSSADATVETVKAPAMRPLVADGAAVRSEASTEVTFPAWINGSPLSQMERLAVLTVNRGLAADEPVQVRLREMAEDRRVEVRNLAVHCLTLLGDFDAFLPLLNDEKQKINWSSQIEAVRSVLARSPDMAKKLKDALESQRDPKKAKDLFDMLRGYSKRQLQDGAAARLVADLDDEDLDFRVLAFWNLQRVSVGTLGYKPEYVPAKRREGVRAWQKKLYDGHIVPKSSG